MLDLETYGIIGYFAFVLFIILIRIIAVAVVAGAISSYVGLTGLLWWCATIGFNYDLDEFEWDLINKFGKESIIKLVKSMNVYETKQLSDIIKLVRIE